ncbi:ribosomal protein L7/L12 [Actinokineospora enzanensis]|uniref:ribosomal protein L7/L12 n=1 Tax=Actinokineospora enzanensis TaxID=155975 RepID=UPI00035CA54D|nr:ribosomal protein L7/L12 [Actinokineospora enzanensis]
MSTRDGLASWSTGIRNDEPASVDALDRDKIARALGNSIMVCETPLVVGLYGSWGTGKTSLMRLVGRHLETAQGGPITVWFDAWRHQFDENPAVALLHTMVDKLGLGEEGRRLLAAIAGALTNAALRAMTVFNATTDFKAFEKQYEEERFQIREKQVRLREHFERLLGRATDDGAVRLVFFIDDLDRCLPENILKTLEALKLFLNMPGCVYVLGVDREALENSINTRYKDRDISERYLDKIVQVPFSLPPVSTDSTTSFVCSLLPESLHDIAADIVAGLGTNPRRIKRFVNSFILNDELAKQTFAGTDYEVRILAALLVVQYQRPDFYKEITELRDALAPDDTVEKTVNSLTGDRAVGRLIAAVEQDAHALDGYIYLSEAVGVRRIDFDVLVTEIGEFKINLIKVVREHNGVGLKEAKEMVESDLPIIVGTGLSRAAAEELVEQIRGTGSKGEIS